MKSAYVVSNSVRTVAPIIAAPAAGCSILNPRPRVLVNVTGTASAINAAGYTASSAINLANGRRVILRSNDPLSGNQTVSVTATDASGNITPAAGMSFRIGYIEHSGATHGIPGEKVLAVQILNLRLWVNNIRAYYTLAQKIWAVNVTSGSTKMAGWQSIVLELRLAIEDVVKKVNGWDTASTVHRIALPAWIQIDEHMPAGVVMTQLWDVLEML